MAFRRIIPVLALFFIVLFIVGSGFAKEIKENKKEKNLEKDTG